MLVPSKAHFNEVPRYEGKELNKQKNICLNQAVLNTKARSLSHQAGCVWKYLFLHLFLREVMVREAEGATAGLVACASGWLPSQKPYSALVLDT